MPYRWEKYVDGQWRPIAAGELPAWPRTKKSVMWALRGVELSRTDTQNNEERFRIVKQSDRSPPADQLPAAEHGTD